MRSYYFLIVIIVMLMNYSCRQAVVGEKNMHNAKKMSGVWEVYEESTSSLNGTLICYYNLDNELEANVAYYYRTSGITSTYSWWMEKNDYLFLYNHSSKITYRYQILDYNKNEYRLQRDDGTTLKLIRKIKS